MICLICNFDLCNSSTVHRQLLDFLEENTTIIMVAEPFVAAHTAHASDAVAHHIIHIFGKPIGKKYQQRQLVLEHSGSLATFLLTQ